MSESRLLQKKEFILHFYGNKAMLYTNSVIKLIRFFILHYYAHLLERGERNTTGFHKEKMLDIILFSTLWVFLSPSKSQLKRTLLT